jgi:hypothetical protein
MQAVTNIQRRITTMKKNLLWTGGGVAALGIALLALPGRSAALQEQDDASPSTKVQRIPGSVDELQRIQIDGERAMEKAHRALEKSQGVLAQVESLDPEIERLAILEGDEGPSWLGIEPVK